MRLIYNDKNPHADTTICIYEAGQGYYVKELDNQISSLRDIYPLTVDKYWMIQKVRRDAALWETSDSYVPRDEYFDYLGD